jgi:hypothetical protein
MVYAELEERYCSGLLVETVRLRAEQATQREVGHVLFFGDMCERGK